MLPALLSMLPGLASAAGGIFGMFNKKKNPADAANNYLDQIPGQIGKYYSPYQQAGGDALKSLTGEYGTMVNDPNAIYNKLAGGYKESPGYKMKLNEALQSGQNAQAAGGALGTPGSQQFQVQTANDIAEKDFEDYMNRMSGIYGGGISGQQGMETQGYDANTSMANMLAQITGQKAQNAFTGQQGQNQASSANWQNIFGGLGAAGQGYNNFNQQKGFMDWLNKGGQ